MQMFNSTQSCYGAACSCFDHNKNTYILYHLSVNGQYFLL